MPVASIVSLTLLAAAGTAAGQAAPPPSTSQELSSPRPSPAAYAELANADTPQTPDQSALKSGQLRPVRLAQRSRDFATPFACNAKICHVRTAYIAQHRHEPDSHD